MGPVGELVVAGSPVQARGVDQLDISVGSNEMLETLLELLQVVDGLAEVGQVVHVLELHVVDGGGSGEDREGAHGRELHVEETREPQGRR